jgi:LuxR family transcriptional regulator, maltose regulon positive regulatory protein
MGLDCAPASLGRPVVPPPVSQARPPLTSWPVVARRHLLRRITRAADEVPLTLICAPAGTGKTVLAADWARRRAEDGRPVAWLTMTGRDNHPGVFWAHLQLALTVVGAVAPQARTRPMFPDAADIDELSTRLLQLSAPAVLVIDAAERLRAGTVNDHIGRLIDFGGDRFRLVVTSRTEPPLPLQRYQVENRVAELRATELALDRDEVAELLDRHSSDPMERSEEVFDRTEGWAAGVRLAALRLESDGPHAVLDGFARSYVRAEIVDALNPHERAVLTATSVADELPPGLASALTGRPDADGLIRTSSSGNSFVLPLSGRPGVFRLHPLVREELRADLDQATPGRAAVLHRRAAEWFHERGELRSAVRHVAATGEWDAVAARLVEGRGLAEVVVGTPTGTALAEGLAAIPETSPDASVLRAAIALRTGDLDASRAALDRADDRPGSGRRGVASSLVRAAWCDAAGQPVEALAAAREARSLLDRLDEPDPFTAAAVATAEGGAHLRAGDLGTACASLGETVAATAGTDGPLRLRCLAELSLAEACAGRLTRALELADAAEQAASDSGVPASLRPAAVELARAWVAVERQELREAQQCLDRVGRTRESRGRWRAITLLLRARYLRDRGDVGGARRQLGRAGAAAGWLRLHLDAESRGLAGESTSARAATPSGHVHDLLEHADHRCQAGDVAAARASIARALQLARTERLRRPFAHASPQVRTLIRGDVRMHAKARWLHPDQLGDAANATQLVTEPVLDPLTERELEVLRHLAAFLTTEEIAAEMYISVNTVRTHVRRLLEKLSVSRRHEAVRRGQELGLV